MAAVTPTRLVTFGPERLQERIGELELRVLGPAHAVRGEASNLWHPGLFRELSWATVVHCHQTHILASSLAAIFSRLTGRRVFTSDLGGGGWDLSTYISTDRLYHGHLHISEYSRNVSGHQKLRTAHLIMGGVDVDRFHPGAVYHPTGPALFVGRLLPHKGVDHLVEAASEECPVRLIGQPYHPPYAEKLKALASGKQVEVSHGIDDVQLVEAYRSARCIVLPSVYRDCYGNETRVPELLGQTLLEGMACGIPAICTDVASMPEIVTDGVNGFIVPPNDAAALRDRVAWLGSHPEEARRMGRAARQSVLDRFTWQQVVERCLPLYSRTSAVEKSRQLHASIRMAQASTPFKPSPAREAVRSVVLLLARPFPRVVSSLVGRRTAAKWTIGLLRSMPASTVRGLTWQWLQALGVTSDTENIWSEGHLRGAPAPPLKVNPRCLGSRYFVATGFWEPELSAAVNRSDRHGLLVDIGANYGYYSRLWLTRPNRRVVSIEPVQEYVALLQENLSPFGEAAVIVQACIGNADGTGVLETSGDPTMLSRLVPEDAASGVSRRVEVHRLDTLLDRLGEPLIDVLKVDAEGHDIAILQSCEALFRAGAIRTVFWESNVGHQQDQFIDVLKQLEYRCILDGVMLGYEKE